LPERGLYLHFNAQGLRLCQLVEGLKPVSVQADFIAGKTGFRLQQSVGRHQPIAKAVGAHKKLPLHIIDLTAGLGRDAMVLAMIGCHVTLFERHPVIAVLLQDALQRAESDYRLATVIEQNIDFHQADALPWLLANITQLERPVVYYDPMFPKREKSSLVKKEMQMFQHLVGDDEDVAETFAALMQLEVSRIVVKRPRLAPLVSAGAPSHQIISKTTRWDIYLPSSGKGA